MNFFFCVIVYLCRKKKFGVQNTKIMNTLSVPFKRCVSSTLVSDFSSESSAGTTATVGGEGAFHLAIMNLYHLEISEIKKNDFLNLLKVQNKIDYSFIKNCFRKLYFSLRNEIHTS